MSGPRGPAGKGFVPKAPVGTSTQKRDQRNTGDDKDPRNPTSSEKKTFEADEEKTGELVQDTEADEQRNDKDPSIPTSREYESGKKTLKMIVGGEKQTVEISEGKKIDGGDDNGKIAGTSLKEKNSTIVKSNANEGCDSIMNDDDFRADDVSLDLKLEMEANLHKQVIEELAEENFFRGNKMFYYPQVVKPDQDIEVFLNRSLSTLSNEADVMIMGAFNDWRWKSFTIKLNKSDLLGDWWSCKVHIPKEAYKMDFVFFNGADWYDNNNQKDFCIPVASGMDRLAFEDFLLEEKRRELEKLAKEQAEKERQAEEQRRIEAEKVAREADRAQAKVETERLRGLFQGLMKKAKVSVDNVWYIEPQDFQSGDLVRLYYNKSSGPLVKASSIWLHGGHNNWKHGLSIVGSLVKDEKKEDDWWYVEGMHGYISYYLLK